MGRRASLIAALEDHGWMLKFLEHRIADRRVLRLIRKWLKAGVIENGARSEVAVDLVGRCTRAATGVDLYGRVGHEPDAGAARERDPSAPGGVSSSGRSPATCS